MLYLRKTRPKNVSKVHIFWEGHKISTKNNGQKMPFFSLNWPKLIDPWASLWNIPTNHVEILILTNFHIFSFSDPIYFWHFPMVDPVISWFAMKNQVAPTFLSRIINMYVSLWKVALKIVMIFPRPSHGSVSCYLNSQFLFLVLYILAFWKYFWLESKIWNQ